MRKSIKWCLIVLAAIVAGFLLWFYLAFFGNPISKALAKNSAEKYIKENYPDCYIENSDYNFKDGTYFANIQKKNSIDTNFYLTFDWWGNLEHDSYDNYVTSGHNTANRLMMEYRELLREAIPQKEVDFELDIFYGDILTEYWGKEISEMAPDDSAYMPMEELLLDKKYDYAEVSPKYGHVVLYAMHENVSFDKAAEILLLIKERLANANLSFRYIDFVLEKPRNEDGTRDWEERINVKNFSWDDIYEIDLEERISIAHEKLEAYYAKLDTEKLNGKI
jgi:hypothetical protein